MMMIMMMMPITVMILMIVMINMIDYDYDYDDYDDYDDHSKSESPYSYNSMAQYIKAPPVKYKTMCQHLPGVVQVFSRT